ncbi:vacuolar protein sorting-associated protein 51 homolog [Diaphorina citri]|uniref:Vacuolar protein sorting-associated protein 51 homolog n=1 Tax=Diaphorina citri TaxID=121845 RepID=A0A3Q0JAI2_DIACI|nr:vacuolar protein sorting-associated protein 51 homolog [Diaphorina citri]
MSTNSTKLTQSPTDDSGQNTLSTELMPLGVAIVEKVKAVLQDLMLFLQPEIGFASSLKNRKFLEHFCVDSVREGLVVALLHHINSTALDFTDQANPTGTPPLTLLLILCKMCQEYERHHVTNLVSNGLTYNLGSTNGLTELKQPLWPSR